MSANNLGEGFASSNPPASRLVPGIRFGANFIGPPSGLQQVGRLGRFELLALVGEGGMARVYKARDPQRLQPVAIKALKPELSGDRRAVQYFLKEAQHMHRLSHPNILSVWEYQREPGGLNFFVMPFCEQGSLAGLVNVHKPLDQAFIVSVGQQITAALVHAHRHGILHRDVKPTNILLESGRAMLSDFGLCRTLLNDELLDVRERLVEGTPHYQSPTAAAGEHEDTRGDIYSFGAVLYEMLTGRPPYAEVPANQVVQHILAGPPTSIRTLNPRAPWVLVRMARWAMARNLHERYAHMADLAADFDRVSQGLYPLGPRRRIGILEWLVPRFEFAYG